MSTFGILLKTRHEQIDDQLLELLLSFADFMLFKEIMICKRRYIGYLAHKTTMEMNIENNLDKLEICNKSPVKEGKNLNENILMISGNKTSLHNEEVF